MPTVINLSFIVIFFGLLAASFYLGKYISRRQFARRSHHNVTGHKIVEGSIFALMGLLVAFTFTNASQKLDHRRELIIDEANAIGTAYLRLDLLQTNAKLLMQSYFKRYLQARLNVYHAIPNYELAQKSVNESLQLQDVIWAEAVKDCKNTGLQSTCMLLLPALNGMFDIASTRMAVTQIHLPMVIFYLLVGLAILSCFLAGYDLEYHGEEKARIFVICYTFVMALTIYMIIDMEYPRMGLIQLTSFDNKLIEVLAKMKD